MYKSQITINQNEINYFKLNNLISANELFDIRNMSCSPDLITNYEIMKLDKNNNI